MARCLFAFAIATLSIHHVSSLGCMPKICDNNEKNVLRGCPDSDRSCGHFHGTRKSGEIVDAVDILCKHNAKVFAPFDGELVYQRTGDGKTCNEGVRIEGTGQWQGYAAEIKSLSLNRYGGTVKAGQLIGRANNRDCSQDTTGEPHVQLKLHREGRVVDPTYHLQQCMCTGMICESNNKNRLLGESFKPDPRYKGVRGWDLECPMIEEDEEEPRAPVIYSPIVGEIFGRIRIDHDDSGSYIGCENDGIFIVGSEEWIGFEVRLYNVKARSELGFGRKRIIQGEPIGTRLTCSNSPDSVFVEVRYQGRVVDISDLITANKCLLPELPDLL